MAAMADPRRGPSEADRGCVAFLQWALPRLGRRWTGYRRFRRLVCRRIRRRCAVLGLGGLDTYRVRLETDPAEWRELDALLGIPVSRFLRDTGVFAAIEREILPARAAAARAGARALCCWSAGCAAGEEAYTLAILWRLRLQDAFPGVRPRVVATDRDAGLLQRARLGCYGASSLKELPEDLRQAAFERRGDVRCLRAPFRGVEFLQQDLRVEMPDGPFDLVLCRNVVATYYEEPVQRQILRRIARRLRPGGALVLGAHEALPEVTAGFEPWPGLRAIRRRTGEEVEGVADP